MPRSFLLILTVLASTLLGATSPAWSADLAVASGSDLKSALANAKSGDRLLLAPGDYGPLNIYIGRDPWAAYSAPVTILSAKPDEPAIISELRLGSVRNMRFENILFRYKFMPGDPEFKPPFMVENSDTIVFSGCTFQGDLAQGTGTDADGFATAKGLNVLGSSNIEVSDNLFHTWLRGAVFSNSEKLVITRNEFRNLRSDGMDFSNVQHVIIDGNHIHDLVRAPTSKDHPDMIQFWTTGTTKPSTDIVISHNILDKGAGLYTQSIFMRNEVVDQKKAGSEMFYRNIEISDNVIRNAHLHGITVGETNGLKIANNTLLQSVSIVQGGTVSAPAIIIAKQSINVSVKKNIAIRIAPNFAPVGHNWRFDGNVMVQRDNTSKSDHYRFNFVNGEAGDNATLKDLRLLPGGPADRAGAGSSLSKFKPPASGYDGVILNQTTGPSPMQQKFRTANLVNAEGLIATKGLVYEWAFGDGSTSNEAAPVHEYAENGSFEASVVISQNGNPLLTLHRTVVIQ